MSMTKEQSAYNQSMMMHCEKCGEWHYWFRICGVKEPQEKYHGVPWSRVYKRYPWLKGGDES